jgi:hypothetical protein
MYEDDGFNDASIDVSYSESSDDGAEIPQNKPRRDTNSEPPPRKLKETRTNAYMRNYMREYNQKKKEKQEESEKYVSLWYGQRKFKYLRIPKEKLEKTLVNTNLVLKSIVERIAIEEDLNTVLTSCGQMDIVGQNDYLAKCLKIIVFSQLGIEEEEGDNSPETN